jgi:hypothetical protein
MAFLRWFLEENELEEGMVDPLADIIKDQLFVNPLEFLDVDVDEAQVSLPPTPLIPAHPMPFWSRCRRKVLLICAKLYLLFPSICGGM